MINRWIKSHRGWKIRKKLTKSAYKHCTGADGGSSYCIIMMNNNWLCMIMKWWKMLFSITV